MLSVARLPPKSNSFSCSLMSSFNNIFLIGLSMCLEELSAEDSELRPPPRRCSFCLRSSSSRAQHSNPTRQSIRVCIISLKPFSSLPAIFITKIKVIYILESERAATTKRKIAEILLKMSVFLARLSRWIWFYAVANTVRTTIRLRGISVDSFSLRSLSLFLAGSCGLFVSRVVNPKQT